MVDHAARQLKPPAAAAGAGASAAAGGPDEAALVVLGYAAAKGSHPPVIVAPVPTAPATMPLSPRGMLEIAFLQEPDRSNDRLEQRRESGHLRGLTNVLKDT
jgi:hypothetical protein